MKATLIECPFGILAFGEEKELIGKTVFPKKAQIAASFLLDIEAGKVPKEIADLVNDLQNKGYDAFVFENKALAQEVEKKLNVKVETSGSSRAGELLRSNIEEFAVKTGFVQDAQEFRLWVHQLTLEMSKAKVKKTVEKRDLVASQAVQSLDELDKITNMLMARIREWYGIHFPELDRLLDKHETYARLAMDLGSRENFTVENLRKEEIPETKAVAIAKVAEKSMGADLADADLKQIHDLCKEALSLYQQRQSLEKYLDSTMEEVAPNTRNLVGSSLGARMIAIAGGLTNLAKRPASTVQVLGAEKALFRSLKTGSRPPKHGLIFQHTLLHDAKRWQRGKIARAISGKLAIAARADAFGHRYIADELKRGLDKRVEEIRQKYDQPPAPMVQRPRFERSNLRKKGRRKRER